jgi:hypothetical protein
VNEHGPALGYQGKSSALYCSGFLGPGIDVHQAQSPFCKTEKERAFDLTQGPWFGWGGDLAPFSALEVDHGHRAVVAVVRQGDTIPADSVKAFQSPDNRHGREFGDKTVFMDVPQLPLASQDLKKAQCVIQDHHTVNHTAFRSPVPISPTFCSGDLEDPGAHVVKAEDQKITLFFYFSHLGRAWISTGRGQARAKQEHSHGEENKV